MAELLPIFKLQLPWTVVGRFGILRAAWNRLLSPYRPIMLRRICLYLLLVSAGFACGGCAQWKRPSFDLSHLRDPRAVDIDDRLSAPLDVRTREGE